jgi:DNA-binding NtrC family response regulator
MDGQPHQSVEAKEGARILIGSTLLAVVATGIPAASRPGGVRGPTDVRTLLTGVGADVRAMAGLHALIEGLDAVQDRGSLDGVLRAWSSAHTPCTALEIRSAPDAQTSSQVTERDEHLATTVVVPAPGENPFALAFTFTLPEGRVTDSLRRTLVVAGRLFGSSVERIRRAEIAQTEVTALRSLSFGSAETFLGSSPGAQQVAAKIPRLAGSDVSLLIEGETGVGKTFVARLVHEASPRAREPLRVINCAAIPENLVESELFGHERGAFTGASARRIGALEAAGRGTLFLDEIGELSPGSQAKLLHVLEGRRFERIGSNQELELRARVICATNRDLESMAQEGLFRRDLLFRVAVVRVRVPPLRERGDDLPQLARQVLGDVARSAGRRMTGFSSGALDLICLYSWPGNVRELRNAIEHAVVFGEGPVVEAHDLPVELASKANQPADPDLVRLPLAIPALERRAIEAALRATNGNRMRAAVLLEMNRSTFYTKLKEYGL